MKKLAIFVLGLITSLGVSASNFGAGTSMHKWDVETYYGDLAFSIPTLNFTYENRFDDNLAFQAKVGFGMSDDSDTDDYDDAYEVKIKHLIQLKGMYFFNENIYGAATFTRFKAEVYSEWDDDSYTDSDDDFGFMLGYKVDNLDLYLGPTVSENLGDVFEFGFNYFF